MRLAQTRGPVKHYAILGDLEGIATLVPSGYSFQAEGETSRRLVSYRDSNLTLLGLVSLADAQHDADQKAGLGALAAGRSY